MNGVKYDDGKARWDLLDLSLLDGVVQVLTMGAKKYADDNWKIVQHAQQRYQSAFMRHFVKYQKNPLEKDKESELFHLDHAICNLIFLRWFVEQGSITNEHTSKD